MDVRLPDGTVITNVPEGTTKEQLAAKLAGRYGFPPAGETQSPDQPQQADQGSGRWYVSDEAHRRANMPQREGAGDNSALRVLGELAASANRGVTEFIDFLGPDTANAILSLSGTDYRLPTLTGALEPFGIEGNFMAPGTAREIVQAGGATLTAAAGLKPVERTAGAIGNAVLDVLGAGSSAVTAPVAAGAKQTAAAISDSLPSLPQSKAAKDAELPLKRATGDASTFGYKLDESGRAVADPAQKAAAKQGFDEGFVAMVNSAPPRAKKAFSKMVDIVEKGKANYRNRSNRPLDVVGESLLNRVKVVKAANLAAGQRIDAVAKSLKGEPVDIQPAVANFQQRIDDMGIKFDPSKPEGERLDFLGSDIEGLEGLEGFWNNFLTKMQNRDVNDAYDVHRIKKFIDESVTYGKSQTGLGGKTEHLVKGLRHDLNQILGEQFPEYRRVNTQYSETIDVLDELQGLAGKKTDLMGNHADQALGTLSRRVLSNAQSAVPLRNTFEKLDDVAKKYITPGSDIVPFEQGQRQGALLDNFNITIDDLDDNLLDQLDFASELDSHFRTHARNSLQGEMDKMTDKAIDAAAGTQTAVGLATEAAKTGWRAARGINEDNALKAIKELVDN